MNLFVSCLLACLCVYLLPALVCQMYAWARAHVILFVRKFEYFIRECAWMRERVPKFPSFVRSFFFICFPFGSCLSVQFHFFKLNRNRHENREN